MLWRRLTGDERCLSRFSFMADSADSTISRPARGRSQKRRASAVSPEIENKLARAARSAQRLAQLSDAARDHSTLDLFPDDTARAAQQAMNIDVRQGTLQGFELPDVVLAAAGATDAAGFAAGLAEAKAGLRGTRAAASASKESAQSDDPHAGQMLIETEAVLPEPAAASGAGAADEPLSCALSAENEAATSASIAKTTGDGPSQAASRAAASVMRSVAALRQASAAPAGSAEPKGRVKPTALNGATERTAAARAEAEAAARNVTAADVSEAAYASDVSAGPAGGSAAIDANGGNSATEASATEPAAQSARAPQFARVPSQHAPASRTTPDLDHARATAFADTVDALYGVIADQRRAAADHSRRMKWLLTIVVCALLATIAIGVAQTLLLLRLAHQSMTQQQRIEQMMLNQQATLATLLDTDSSTTSLPVNAQASLAASSAAAIAPAKPADAHAAHAQHTQRRKSAHAH